MPHERPVAGRSFVTRRAILDIVRTAVQGSYGVTGFGDRSLAGRLRRWFRLGGSGIELGHDEDGLTIDLFLTVAYGVPVAEVARQVDSAVRYAIRRATGAEVSCVSIHVGGLRYQPAIGRHAEPPVPETTRAADQQSPADAPAPGGDGNGSRAAASNGHQSDDTVEPSPR